jgi:hypothetical protein
MNNSEIAYRASVAITNLKIAVPYVPVEHPSEIDENAAAIIEEFSEVNSITDQYPNKTLYEMRYLTTRPIGALKRAFEDHKTIKGAYIDIRAPGRNLSRAFQKKVTAYRVYQYAALELGRSIGKALFKDKLTPSIASEYLPISQSNHRPRYTGTVAWLLAQANWRDYLLSQVPNYIGSEDNQVSVAQKMDEAARAPNAQAGALSYFLGSLKEVRTASGIYTNYQKRSWWHMVANQRMRLDKISRTVKLRRDNVSFLAYLGEPLYKEEVIAEAPLPENFDLRTFCFKNPPTQRGIEAALNILTIE